MKISGEKNPQNYGTLCLKTSVLFNVKPFECLDIA